MVYFDNLIFSLQRAGGISVVWQNLIYNLLELSNLKDIRFIEYKNAMQNIFRVNLNLPSSHINIINKFNPIIEQFKSPKIVSDNKFIFHSSYFRTCNNPNAINITTVHDFIYEQGNPTWKQKLRIRLNYNAIRKSDAVVCISENTKKDLFKYLPEIDQSKVHVIYNGVSQDYYPLGEIPYPEYRSYVLFVGGRQGYKNFDFLVKALEKVDYKLLICGVPFTNKEKSLLDRFIPNRYKLIEYPSNNDLNKIYNSVDCLVYPSSYEGFGLPVLEAQRAGCPVIALAASSIPEIVGNYPLLIPILKEPYLIDALAKIKDPEIRAKVIDSGFQAANRFSWRKMAEEYLNLYNILLGK